MRCEVLRREGTGFFPCVVRTADGRVLRLYGDAAPRHARWLGMHEGVAVWAESADVGGAGTGQFIEVDAEESIDEVGVSFGPDRDVVGLFDSSRSDSELTGERTGVATEEAGVEQQRTAFLAWLAGSLDDPGGAPEQGPPCGALRARLADEPPELLPALSSASVSRPGRVTRPPPAVTHTGDPDRDDTVTQIDLLRPPQVASPEITATGTTTGSSVVSGLGRWITAERVVWLAPWVAGSLLAAAGLAWWIWGRVAE